MANMEMVWNCPPSRGLSLYKDVQVLNDLYDLKSFIDKETEITLGCTHDNFSEFLEGTHLNCCWSPHRVYFFLGFPWCLLVCWILTPEIDNSLNVAQCSPGGLPILCSRPSRTDTPSNEIGVSNTFKLYPDIYCALVDIIGQHYQQPSTCWRNPPAKRDGSSCKEIMKCHDGVADIIIKIS